MALVLAAGIGCGLLGVWASTRFLANLLFGLTPMDPGTIAASVLLLVVTTAAAVYAPIRKALAVDVRTQVSSVQ